MRVGSFVIDRDPVYVGSGTLRVMTHLLAAVGVVALGVGLVLLGAALTGSPESLRLPVSLAEGATGEQADAHITDRAYAQSGFSEGENGHRLTSNEPTRTEILLDASADVLLAVAIGVSALLLRPVLASIAHGQPFGSGNARRLAYLAVVTVIPAALVPVLPQLAALSVLDRLALAERDSPFVMGVQLSLTPVLLLPLVFLVLAEAFRQGEKLHRDVEGLV